MSLLSTPNTTFEVQVNTVTVRWLDSFLEEFQCINVRFSPHMLWLQLTNGKERIIPLSSVRWFSQSVKSAQR